MFSGVTIDSTMSTRTLDNGTLYLLGLAEGDLLAILLFDGGGNLPCGGIDIYADQLLDSRDEKFQPGRLCSLDVLRDTFAQGMTVIGLACGDTSESILCIEVDANTELTIGGGSTAGADTLLVAVQNVRGEVLLDGPCPQCILEGEKARKFLVFDNCRHLEIARRALELVESRRIW